MVPLTIWTEGLPALRTLLSPFPESAGPVARVGLPTTVEDPAPRIHPRVLDRYLPRLHRLLIRVGLLPEPRDLRVLLRYLTRLQAAIEQELGEHLPAYNDPPRSRTRMGVDVSDPIRRPIRRVIRQILGAAKGGDSVMPASPS